MFDDVLARTERQLPSLRPAETKMARLVLDSPQLVLELPISRAADAAGVSMASVVRFCRAIGFGGYSDFRRALAVTLSRESTDLGLFGVSETDIAATDDAKSVLAKVALHDAKAIQDTANGLDVNVFDSVVELFSRASRIDIYGSASSSVAGFDLQQKLHRLGLTSFQWSDPHLALTSASILNESAVAVGFSHSGVTRGTVQALSLAREFGAKTVAVTNYPASPLARTADFLLPTTTRDTRYRTGAMSSRMAQLAIVDFLFVRVAQQLHSAKSEQREERLFKAMQDHRLSYED